MCPIYEYQCEQCECVEEIICPYVYEEEVLCPYCTESQMMHRILSSGGFILTGDGFYKTGRS